jgi:hypothetical protein
MDDKGKGAAYVVLSDKRRLKQQIIHEGGSGQVIICRWPWIGKKMTGRRGPEYQKPESEIQGPGKREKTGWRQRYGLVDDYEERGG